MAVSNVQTATPPSIIFRIDEAFDGVLHSLCSNQFLGKIFRGTQNANDRYLVYSDSYGKINEWWKARALNCLLRCSRCVLDANSMEWEWRKNFLWKFPWLMNDTYCIQHQSSKAVALFPRPSLSP